MAKIDELRRRLDELTGKGIANLTKDEKKEFAELYLEINRLLKDVVFVYGSLRRGQYNHGIIDHIF